MLVVGKEREEEEEEKKSKTEREVPIITFILKPYNEIDYNVFSH